MYGDWGSAPNTQHYVATDRIKSLPVFIPAALRPHLTVSYANAG